MKDYGIVERQLWLKRQQQRTWPAWITEVDITLYFLLGLTIAVDLVVWMVR